MRLTRVIYKPKMKKTDQACFELFESIILQFVWLPQRLSKPLCTVFIHSPTQCKKPRFIRDMKIPRKWKAIIKKDKRLNYKKTKSTLSLCNHQTWNKKGWLSLMAFSVNLIYCALAQDVNQLQRQEHSSLQTDGNRLQMISQMHREIILYHILSYTALFPKVWDRSILLARKLCLAASSFSSSPLANSKAKINLSSLPASFCLPIFLDFSLAYWKFITADSRMGN